jgi:hypothetical protein
MGKAEREKGTREVGLLAKNRGRKVMNWCFAMIG